MTSLDVLKFPSMDFLSTPEPSMDGPSSSATRRVAPLVAPERIEAAPVRYASGGLILKAMQDRRERGSQDVYDK